METRETQLKVSPTGSEFRMVAARSKKPLRGFTREREYRHSRLFRLKPLTDPCGIQHGRVHVAARPGVADAKQPVASVRVDTLSRQLEA